MMLNRKARRAKKKNNWMQSSPTASPQEQLRAFLQAPGKMYIINLPGQKSTVMKVRAEDEQFFRFFCGQLTGVLGSEDFQVIPATPVDAQYASTQEIAEQTAAHPARLREAQRRQDEAQREPQLHVVRDDTELDASMNRHPAGKQRGGRHRAPEPDTTFDRFARGGVVRDEEDRRRIAAMEIAAAQDAAARAADALEAANERLREAYATGGELHNRAVLDRFAERAAEKIAEQPPAQPERPDQRQNRLIGDAIDHARQAAIDEALRQAGADAGTAFADGFNDGATT